MGPWSPWPPHPVSVWLCMIQSVNLEKYDNPIRYPFLIGLAWDKGIMGQERCIKAWCTGEELQNLPALEKPANFSTVSEIWGSASHIRPVSYCPHLRITFPSPWLANLQQWVYFWMTGRVFKKLFLSDEPISGFSFASVKFLHESKHFD